jgi:1,4-dihydroxy-6-naphthoate synthase
VYIFAGLILNRVPTGGWRFEIAYRDVENLNQAAQRAEYDLVKVSYANYPRMEANYLLLDSGGALGRGVGPLLLTNGTDFSLRQPVLVPGEFTTANFLLDFYLGKPVPKRYLSFDKVYEELCRTPGAQGVVIHEKRFTYEQDGLRRIADLGDHWERETGCAIPLGAIALHRRHTAQQSAFETLIRESLRWAREHDAEAVALCQEHAQDLNPAVVRAHIELYVNAYSETLGAEGRAAVACFLGVAAQRSG